MIKLMLSIALLAIPNSATAEPSQYLCVVEQSAGLHYNQHNKQWAPQEFSTTRKYIFRRLKDEDRDREPLMKSNHPQDDWGFFEFGKPHPETLASCRDVGQPLGEFFQCHENWEMAEFDSTSLRFEIIRYGGYTSQGFWEHQRSNDPNAFKQKPGQDPDHPDDLFFEIGRCSAL
jgi:hypothetical protein